MLVLTRKLMEKLYIGDHICITVVRLEGGQVRLGIDAPREISVVRAELRPHTGHKEAPDAPESVGSGSLEARIRSCQTVPLGTGIRRRAPSR